ncbi:alkaline shock response membrane anchor protein AmaP [Streptomyces sp. URMC 123]|uniref:alkaline shock response membrane anchor protein AmaP n=1 Tax=Streptomyces sp. URMC 123 TaxID=3423403 RepID=UPI003F19A09D
MLKAVNRVLVGLTGLGLFALGGAVLLGVLDARRRWNLALPDWWFLTGPDDVVLGDWGRTRFRDEGWWWPVVIAVLALLLVALLWWFLVQWRRPRIDEVLIDSGDGTEARVRAAALEEVTAAEASDWEGVAGTRVRLAGRRTAPVARVTLTLDGHAAPRTALTRLSEEALERARSSLGLERLPARVRLRAARHRARKVT